MKTSLTSIEEIVTLSNNCRDRREFHTCAQNPMRKMMQPEFIHTIFEMNLSDKRYTERPWTTYEIPFLYVYENDHFYLKFHIFPPVASGDIEKSANIIHHHNNYLLTSLTVQGPGYHTMHFDKEIVPLADSRVRIKLTKDFFHGKAEFSFVDSYEPHLVFNMGDLTTTLVLWSPDELHVTDGLRNHPLIKPFKGPLLKLIHALGLSRAVGVADKQVYQWYVHDNEVVSILEEDYFGRYKAISGPETDLFYTQAVSSFVQRSGYANYRFLDEKIMDKATPAHWRQWLIRMKENEPIPPVYGKEEINIPGGRMTMADVRNACA